MRAAVVGCGRMGAEPSARLAGAIPNGWLPLSHVEAIQATPGVELVALCDTDEALLRRRGQHYGVDRLYTDSDALLSEIQPEIVTIATRTPAKAAIMEAACRVGVRGVYVEKPLANSVAECRRLLVAAANAGVAVHYGVNRRYHRAYRDARTLVASGELGEVVEVSVEHGRGPLLWSHPHSVDLILFLLGTIRLATVTARLEEDTIGSASARCVDGDPVIEHAWFQFAGGQSAAITRGGGLNVRIACTAGTVTVRCDGAQVQVHRPGALGPAYFIADTVTDTAPGTGATVTALAELVSRVTAGETGREHTAHIDTGIQMLVGCVWSHLAGGGPIAAAAIPDDFVVTGQSGGRFA